MRRAPRPCAVLLCPELTDQNYCELHGETPAGRGYDRAWRKLSRAVLADDAFECASCGGLATEVDHIDGDARNRDRTNLRSMCRPCHSKRTHADQSGYLQLGAVTRRRQPEEADGVDWPIA